MKDVCVCFIGSNETAKLLASKATTSDIEMSHYAQGDNVLTIVRPIGFPEKIKPLIQAVMMSERVIIEVKNIDKFLGEVIILLDLLGKKGEFIIPSDKQFVISQLELLSKGTKTENYEKKIISSNEDIKNIKEELLKIEVQYGDNPLIIIDDFFSVKGVGVVALGFTKGGVIKAKDQLFLQPAGKNIQVNSIQVMDVDYREIKNPARVGIALKNCDLEDLERGSVLSKGLPETSEIKGEIKKSKYYKKEITGQTMMINGLISIQGEIKDGKVIFSKKIPILTDTVIYDQSASPRILGLINKE